MVGRARTSKEEDGEGGVGMFDIVVRSGVEGSARTRRRREGGHGGGMGEIYRKTGCWLSY